MKRAISKSTYLHLDSFPQVTEIAEQALEKAGILGILPTPLDVLLNASDVYEFQCLEEFEEGFLKRLRSKTLPKAFETARQTYRSMMQKLRGLADLRERAIYIQPRSDSNIVRQRFVTAHELGHQLIPWHKFDTEYFDDAKTLSPRVQEVFEQEANFFSANVLFQGSRFRQIALDYQPSFEAIFNLANKHQTSIQATIWKYVEQHDEDIAIAHYYPSQSHSQNINAAFSLWQLVPSTKFQRKHLDIQLPQHLGLGDPWLAARDLNKLVDGNRHFVTGGRELLFQWQAFWNHHALLVLLRRAPALKRLGNVITLSR